MGRRALAGLLLLLVAETGQVAFGALATLFREKPATASFDPKTRRWTLGNRFLTAIFRLGRSGRLETTGLYDLSRGVLLVPATLHAGELRVVIRRPVNGSTDREEWGNPVELTGASGWELDDHLESVEADGTAHIDATFVSRDEKIALVLHRVLHPESPVLRSWVEVENRSGRPLLLSAADSLVLGFGAHGDVPSLFSVNNFTWAAPEAAFDTNEVSLAPGATERLTTGPYGGKAAWFALRSESTGGGLFGGWEWSGTGEMVFEADGAGGVRFRLGLSPAAFSHRLEPGARFASPVAFVGVFSGGWDAAGAATRAFVEARIAPMLPAPDFPWVGFDTWGYGSEVNETLVHDLVDRAAGLGVEFFTLDYGWMEREGDWVSNPRTFPGGVQAVSAHAHDRGMRFGLWMAFGSADRDSTVLREHPDWVASIDGVPVLTDFGGRALCLGNPDARDWVVSEVRRVVESYGVDWLVHDFTVLTRCNDVRHGHGVGDGEWASTAGYYTVLEAIRAAHPGLVVENCWDGGGTIDFGMVARHDTSATNDRCNAFGNRRAAFGATYFLPPRYVDKYVGDDGTGDIYRFLSGVPGGPLILMGRPTNWRETTVEAARGAVGFFKRVRGILRDGQVFHLTPAPGHTHIDALESYDGATGTGYIFAYQGGIATDPGGAWPVGLEPGAFYDVCVWNSSSRRLTLDFLAVPGDELMRDGIPLGLVDDESVAVVTFQRR